MVQRTIITLEDDIDGGEADETVVFALDGTTYEIDLSANNADALRGVLYDYTGRARKTSGATRGRKASSRSEVTPAEIRDWGRQNGFEVPDRGRVPAAVREAYEAAN